MTRSEKCMLQAEMFKTRAIVEAINANTHAVKASFALTRDSYNKSIKSMEIAQRHLTNADKATDNALKFSEE